jgi:hypothetical protein
MADKAQPQGYSAKRRATEDDDVEGHRHMAARAVEPDGVHTHRKATEDDVEGHSMLLNPLIARELSHARERDVQANVKRHQHDVDARAAKKEGR